MASIATVSQLAARVQSAFDAYQTATAQLALDNASGMMRQLARQQFDFVSQETVDLAGGGRVLTLPQRPAVVDGSNPLTVVEVGEFGGIDLTLVEDRDFSRIGNELTRGYPWWWNDGQRLMGYPRSRALGVWAPKVRVTYSHGYTTMADDLVALCLDVAQALYSNPDGLRSVTLDDYSETRATELLGAGSVDAIKARLGATGRRRGSFSITT